MDREPSYTYFDQKPSGLAYEMDDGSYHLIYRNHTLRLDMRTVWSESEQEHHPDLFPVWNTLCGQTYDFKRFVTIWLASDYRCSRGQMCQLCLHQRLLMAMKGD